MSRAGRTLLAAALLAPAMASAQAVPALPFRSGQVRFHAPVSGGPDVRGSAPLAAAAYSGSDLAAVQGWAELRVAEMRTGIGLRDRHLRDAMHADSFPVIRFDVLEVRPGTVRGDTIEITFRGRVTMHGQTRDLTAPGTAVLGPRTVSATAAFAVDLVDHGISPPTRFLGTVRVQRVIGIEVGVVFGLPQSP